MQGEPRRAPCAPCRPPSNRAELAKFRSIAGTTPVPSHLMSLPSRLANLSYAQLLEIAVDTCESSPAQRGHLAVSRKCFLASLFLSYRSRVVKQVLRLPYS